MSGTDLPTKTAKVFEGRVLVRGSSTPAETPDWPHILERVKALSVDDRTIDGTIFDPVRTDHGWVLTMHKPLARGYKSRLDSSTGNVLDWLEDEGTYRVAYSTAVVFLERNAAFLLCKGEHSSPGHPDVQAFMRHFIDLPPATHWDVQPMVAEGQMREFQDVAGVHALDLTMTTRRDLFNHDQQGKGRSLDAVLSALSDAIGTDLQVTLKVSIDRPNRSKRAMQRMRDVVNESASWFSAAGKKAVVATETTGGVREALNLVSHDLAVDIVLPPESTERQSFQDLIHALVAEAASLNARLRE